jgi:hypothetical protein
MNKQLKMQKQGSSDDFQTPEIALDYIVPFIDKKWNIWECACGTRNLVIGLQQRGFTVWGTDIKEGFDFLEDNDLEDVDFILTNPPYSIKEKFLERCYEIGKPFALLMPLTALESEKRQKLFRKYGIQLIIPNKRINFETPSGKKGTAWFQVAWFCYKLNLPKDLNFAELK